MEAARNRRPPQREDRCKLAGAPEAPLIARRASLRAEAEHALALLAQAEADAAQAF